jgi:hypothetical protein
MRCHAMAPAMPCHAMLYRTLHALFDYACGLERAGTLQSHDCAADPAGPQAHAQGQSAHACLRRLRCVCVTWHGNLNERKGRIGSAECRKQLPRRCGSLWMRALRRQLQQPRDSVVVHDELVPTQPYPLYTLQLQRGRGLAAVNLERRIVDACRAGWASRLASTYFMSSKEQMLRKTEALALPPSHTTRGVRHGGQSVTRNGGLTCIRLGPLPAAGPEVGPSAVDAVRQRSGTAAGRRMRALLTQSPCKSGTSPSADARSLSL